MIPWRAGRAIRHTHFPRPQRFQRRIRRNHNEAEASKNSTHDPITPKRNPPQSTAKPSSNAAPAAEAASKTIPGPAYFWLDSLSTPLRAFSRAQEKRPYVTQFVSTLTIYFLGDMSAQNLVPANPDDPYSPARTLRALIIGGVASIPGYKWFMWLGNSFNYSSKVLSVATKVAVQQAVFTPIFNTYFFGMQSLLTGGGLVEIWERIKNTLPTSCVNSLKLWPAVTAFSFTFVPMHFRSIFAGTIAIGWQTYLSFLNQKAAKQEREAYFQSSIIETRSALN